MVTVAQAVMPQVVAEGGDEHGQVVLREEYVLNRRRAQHLHG
jgi:hypothetical protein